MTESSAAISASHFFFLEIGAVLHGDIPSYIPVFGPNLSRYTSSRRLPFWIFMNWGKLSIDPVCLCASNRNWRMMRRRMFLGGSVTHCLRVSSWPSWFWVRYLPCSWRYVCLCKARAILVCLLCSISSVSPERWWDSRFFLAGKPAAAVSVCSRAAAAAAGKGEKSYLELGKENNALVCISCQSVHRITWRTRNIYLAWEASWLIYILTARSKTLLLFYQDI